MANNDTVKVWDPLVRVFHWTLAVAFAAAYLTEGEPAWLHVALGYLIVALVLVRTAWGFVGTRHARFTDFVRGPRSVARYLREELGGRAARYLGHNPAGAAMILALMLTVLLTALSGMALLAAEAGEGPLAGWLIAAPNHGLAEAVEEVHEILANGMLLLVLIHVLGVVVHSLRHRENLVRAMITGRKRAAP
jgi:cytochrome b